MASTELDVAASMSRLSLSKRMLEGTAVPAKGGRSVKRNSNASRASAPCDRRSEAIPCRDCGTSAYAKCQLAKRRPWPNAE